MLCYLVMVTGNNFVFVEFFMVGIMILQALLQGHGLEPCTSFLECLKDITNIWKILKNSPFWEQNYISLSLCDLWYNIFLLIVLENISQKIFPFKRIIEVHFFSHYLIFFIELSYLLSALFLLKFLSFC
jgi:hypothetical protein